MLVLVLVMANGEWYCNGNSNSNSHGNGNGNGNNNDNGNRRVRACVRVKFYSGWYAPCAMTPMTTWTIVSVSVSASVGRFCYCCWSSNSCCLVYHHHHHCAVSPSCLHRLPLPPFDVRFLERYMVYFRMLRMYGGFVWFVWVVRVWFGWFAWCARNKTLGVQPPIVAVALCLGWERGKSGEMSHLEQSRP